MTAGSAAQAPHLRWGIIGAGGIAGAFASDLSLTGRTIAGVAARSLDRANAFARDFQVGAAYGDYEELVHATDVDVVYVATIHPQHAAHARLALEAGKHVLVEKPFTMNAAQARELVDLAADRGLVILEAMWTRWLPHMVRIRELLAEGALGEVRTVLADFGADNASAERMSRPELGGGALLDLGIYPVSLAWDVLGEPSSVWARATMTGGVDAETAMVLEYPGGASAVLQTQMTGTGPVRAAIVGTEGLIEVDRGWFTPVGFTLWVDGEVAERFESNVEGRGMQFQAAELERIVASGALAGTVLPPEESVAIMDTLDRVRELIGLQHPRLG